MSNPANRQRIRILEAPPRVVNRQQAELYPHRRAPVPARASTLRLHRRITGDTDRCRAVPPLSPRDYLSPS